MSEFVTDFRYDLKQPFSYSCGGDQKEATHLIIYAPTNKVMQYISVIEKEYNKALFELQEKMGDKLEESREKSTVTQDTDSSEMTSMLVSAFGDLMNCYNALKKILGYKQGQNGMCYIDGVEPMTEALVESMGVADTKLLLGKYIENFISTSPNK